MKQLIKDRQLFIRRIFLMCYDMIAVFSASILALLVRFDFHLTSIPPRYLDEVWKALPYLMLATLAVFWGLRLYSSLWSYAGALEMMYIVSACILDTFAAAAVTASSQRRSNFVRLPPVRTASLPASAAARRSVVR